MKKRYRSRKLRPGELRVYYGRLSDDPTPDIVYSNGPGTHHCDRAYLHYAFGCKRMERNEDAPALSSFYEKIKFSPSLLEELELRGYDLTTLEFSIKKKEGKA